MGEIVNIKRKRIRKPVTIGGKLYVFLEDFAERMGVATNTIYQWRYEGRLNNVCQKYLGSLVFEEKAIEPFKRSLMEKVAVYR